MMATIKDYRLFWLCFFCLTAADQISKIWIVFFSGYPHGAYPPFGGTEIIPGFFNIVYATNYGAAWGIMAGKGSWLIVLGFIALAGIFFFRRDLELIRKPHQFTFGLICGGIIGNTIDRLWHGRVIDFLDFNLIVYHWPTFNFADCGIVVGTGFYLYFSILSSKSKQT